MLEIQPNSRQIPKSKEICANKKYNDILYAYLQNESVMEKISGKRFFSKKAVNFSKLAHELNMSRQTLSTKFKYLQELGLVAERDKDTYWLIKLEPNLAALVPNKTVKILCDTLNERTISTYVYLLNCYYANGCNPFQFKLDQVKAFVGLSLKNRDTNDTITNILYVLEKLGLIKYSLTTYVQEKDVFQNIKTIYQIDWMTNVVG